MSDLLATLRGMLAEAKDTGDEKVIAEVALEIPLSVLNLSNHLLENVDDIIAALEERQRPIPMLLHCPQCGEQHIDEGEWATTRHHRTHLCLKCGHQWRPANVPTVGVASLE